jgi:hypothetical protein
MQATCRKCRSRSLTESSILTFHQVRFSIRAQSSRHLPHCFVLETCFGPKSSTNIHRQHRCVIIDISTRPSDPRAWRAGPE